MRKLVKSRFRAFERARVAVNSIRRVRRRSGAVDEILSAVPFRILMAGTSPSRRSRRDAIEGYVVCVELDEATVVGHGGQFSFQTPAADLEVGRRVWFVREGDRFELL